MKGAVRLNVDYKWWRNDGQPTQPDHRGALKERAEEQIYRQLKKGNREGELSEWIRRGEEDGEDEIYYRGWWQLNP